jgi:hypothetical protein
MKYNQSLKPQLKKKASSSSNKRRADALNLPISTFYRHKKANQKEALFQADLMKLLAQQSSNVENNNGETQCIPSSSRMDNNQLRSVEGNPSSSSLANSSRVEDIPPDFSELSPPPNCLNLDCKDGQDPEPEKSEEGEFDFIGEHGWNDSANIENYPEILHQIIVNDGNKSLDEAEELTEEDASRASPIDGAPELDRLETLE